MLEREINTLSITDWPRTERLIEQLCARAGLWVAMKDVTKQKPRGTIWHLKKEGLPGAMELAVWPEQNRARLSIHDARNAKWLDEMIDRIADGLERL
jgi:hypothetical protein